MVKINASESQTRMELWGGGGEGGERARRAHRGGWGGGGGGGGHYRQSCNHRRCRTGGEEEDKNTGLNTQWLINNETQVCTVKRPEVETTAGRGTSILQNKTGNIWSENQNHDSKGLISPAAVKALCKFNHIKCIFSRLGSVCLCLQ